MANHQPEKPNQAISPGPARPSSATAMTVAVRTSLDAAVALAHAGDHRDARKLCAAVVFNMQPMIATSTELLRATLHALLLAHGFELLARLVLAVSGRRVQVVLLPTGTGPIALPRTGEAPDATTFTMDPRWLQRLTPDDVFLRHWCDTLVARRHSDTPGTAPVTRQLVVV
jgi:hypothetical protein